MRYIVALLFALSLFACKKGEDTGAPPTKDSTAIVPKNTAVTHIYAGRYMSLEVHDDPLFSYFLDTAFLDTISVTFTDSVNVSCKLYTYTIYHDRRSPGIPGPAGRDSLEFSCYIGTSRTSLDTLSPPVRGGSIRFTPDRDSVYFGNLYHSGQSYFYHNASFAGKKQ